MTKYFFAKKVFSLGGALRPQRLNNFFQKKIFGPAFVLGSSYMWILAKSSGVTVYNMCDHT